jgi:hypothetical protein
VLLDETAFAMEDIERIPQTAYTHYRLYRRVGDRTHYEAPFFRKRINCCAAIARLFVGQDDLKDVVQDYLWSLCEETNWVLPAHENHSIDLFSAETGFLFAEAIAAVGDKLDDEVTDRMRAEVERRIFQPYLAGHERMGWYRGPHNWNGVCNSSVAATFLWLQPDPALRAQALAAAMAGLKVYLANAFTPDGASTEGVGYWHYGLVNFIALAEMLRARTGGEVDLLATERMRGVAAYPAKVQLRGELFASFSDCPERQGFSPGIIARLAARTGETSLHNLLGARADRPYRLPMTLRNLLWWDGRTPAPQPAGDAVLPDAEVVRLVAATPAGAPVILALKAGHNAEHHNQNDVGSFILHIGGENLLVDPGRGLYDRFYFGPTRYDNVFASSYGHSVPRVGGRQQAPGREHAGRLVAVEASGPVKSATAELAGAYPVEGLTLTRTWRLAETGGVLLEDRIDSLDEVEEAFVTWGEVTADGATAVVRAGEQAVTVTIESPGSAIWSVEVLDEASRANRKPAVLKRLAFTVPAGAMSARVRLTPAS